MNKTMSAPQKSNSGASTKKWKASAEIKARHLDSTENDWQLASASKSLPWTRSRRAVIERPPTPEVKIDQSCNEDSHVDSP